MVSPFFARPKTTLGKWRPIVSLKKVNKHIRYVKFKMVTTKDIRMWIREGYFFTSIDLKDAYFSIPLFKTTWKFIRFVWDDVTYEFLVNMFGLGPSARLFTKVLASVIRFLRSRFGSLVQGYIDDFIFQAITEALCTLHTHIALIILHVLGFEVNFSKSMLTPTTKISHLGFNWDSVAMTLSVPEPKIDKIREIASDFLDKGGCTADAIRSFVGRLESVRPATPLAPLHYRSLQAMLPRETPWPGRRFLALSPKAGTDLEWWLHSFAPNAVAPLRRPGFTVDMTTDASTRGPG